MINHETVLVILSLVLVVLAGLRFALSEVLAILDQFEEWKERRAHRKVELRSSFDDAKIKFKHSRADHHKASP
jgi:hypothetical protein